jgi:hypothetical protein
MIDADDDSQGFLHFRTRPRGAKRLVPPTLGRPLLILSKAGARIVGFRRDRDDDPRAEIR